MHFNFDFRSFSIIFFFSLKFFIFLHWIFISPSTINIAFSNVKTFRFSLYFIFECSKTVQNSFMWKCHLISGNTDFCFINWRLYLLKSNELEVISVFTLRTRIHTHTQNRSPLTKIRCLFYFYGHFFCDFLSVAFFSVVVFVVSSLSVCSFITIVYMNPSK